MIDGIYFIPLSPPTSPGMSTYHAGSSETEWHGQDLKLLIDPALDAEDRGISLLQNEATSLSPVKRPILRTSKTFPCPLQRPSSHPTPLDSGNSSPAPGERITMSTIEGMDNHELPQVTFGGSAPASPVSRLTPPSPDLQRAEEDAAGPEPSCDGYGECDEDVLDEDMAEEEEPKKLTPQELRAQKRKMKRFRLTHNQTRFLMSEFARQAHPDAAHRERLSREIPGLSPRQVQVWFQNRRAKLKRLTSDDRERMMRSRALPDDFDMTQALHSPFGTNPLASPGPYPPNFSDTHHTHTHTHAHAHGATMMRPLSIDALRRFPDTHMSPTGISPAFASFNFTPPQSATDTLSPVSTSSEGPFTFPPGPMDSPRRSNPFVGSVTSSPAFTSHPQMPRLHIHDRMQRNRADSLASPLRTSLSYESLNSSHEASNVSSTSNYGTSADDSSRSSLSSSIMPYGIGLSYAQIPGFQATASSRIRSFSGSVPRRIELSSHYSSSRSGTTPQTANFPQYHHSPLATPHSYDLGDLSAPHHITSFSNSYLRHDTNNDSYQPVGAVLGEVVDTHSHDGDHESHNGSVHLSHPY